METSPTPARFLLAAFLLCALTRIFYFPFVWADEGLWFTAAQEMLRGKLLYRQIWFDKPPALALTFVSLFTVDGLAAVRAFTILYAFAVALLLWHMGRTLWGESEGRTAALLYAFYNATYIQSQTQPLAGDHLMLLPYLGAGFLYMQGWPTVAGLLASLAFQINPKAAALLLFVALLGERKRLLPFAAGVIAGTAPWIAWLYGSGIWPEYVRDFWGWGLRYVSVYAPWEMLLNGLRRTLNYAGFHLPLIISLGMLLRYAPEPGEDRERRASHALWIWLAVSFLGVAAGGRFFPRYYYQVLPLLCLLAARGYQLYRRAAGPGIWRWVLAAGLLVSLVRFHSRTAALAYEQVTGTSTAYMTGWDDTAMDRDSRRIARAIGHQSLFVWGYRPEIYFYCGCPPASRFLSSQPLTGVPADVHLRESRSRAPEEARNNRLLLAVELLVNKPAYIVDGLGPYNRDLAMEQYPELREILLTRYEREPGEAGHGWIYRLKEMLARSAIRQM